MSRDACVQGADGDGCVQFGDVDVCGCDDAELHASAAVGTLNTGVAGHSIVAGAGSAEIVGLVVSTTVIVWLAVAVFPHASVAVQVRVTR